MFTLQQLEEFLSYIDKNILTSSLPSVKSYKLQQLKSNYSQLFDLTISLSMELPLIKFNINKVYNTFDFKKDVGKVLYAVLNKDEKLFSYVLKNQHYLVQKWWYLIFSKYFTKKYRDDILYELLDDYYKISDLMYYIELPDILDISNSTITIQSIKRADISDLSYPLYLINIPKNLPIRQINYLIKKPDGKVISNIISGKIRNELLTEINYPSFGIIGVTSKIKGYKRKYKFTIVFFDVNYQNVLNLYRGNNYIDLNLNYDLKLNSEIVYLTDKIITINNEDELKLFLKKHKLNKQYVVLTNKGIELLKTNIIYDFAKIVDYIYNEDYEAIGLKIKYKSSLYDIYFNVMETNYVDGIENKYVKISVIKYKDLILKVYYNSEVKQWHKKYSHCEICKSVKYKHKINGICNSCYSKLEKYCNDLYEKKKEKCEAKFNSIFFENFEVFGDGEYIYFNPLKGSQLSLPLYDLDTFCK